MDSIRQFDIQLEKEMYYPGETLHGCVILNTLENFKLKAIRVILKGKAQAEWKVLVGGDRRIVKDEQVLIDDRSTLWGKDGETSILVRGQHSFPFKFQLPESSLPCSFESKPCTIRYFVRVTVDIPYVSPPIGVKYFTMIGPHIDCMDEHYLKPQIGRTKRSNCCFCCQRNIVSVKALLERSAYCSGESIRLKVDIDNGRSEIVRLKLKLVQQVTFYVERGVLKLNKEDIRSVLEYQGEDVEPNQRFRFDSTDSIVVPVMPPTLDDISKLVQIRYELKVWVELDKSGEDLVITFPLTIATCPFRIPNSNKQPIIDYDVCCDHVQGGLYIASEFLSGQVYDGTQGEDQGPEEIVLYRPVYVCVRRAHNFSNSINKSAQSNHELITCEPGPSR